MTDDQRTKARRVIEDLVRLLDSDDPSCVLTVSDRSFPEDVQVSAYVDSKAEPEFAPLPPEKVFALKVLVGDPATLPQALADYLLDMGHQYALEVAERARQEERERCLLLTHYYAHRPGPVTVHDMLSVSLHIQAGTPSESIPSGPPPNPDIRSVWDDNLARYGVLGVPPAQLRAALGLPEPTPEDAVG